MRRKQTLRPCVSVVLLLLLAGCGPATLAVQPTEVNINSLRTQAAATAVAGMTQVAALTPTAIPTGTPTPTPTPGKPFTLQDLRLRLLQASRKDVYEDRGSVYIKDGHTPPVRLTRSGKDRAPILSDDGWKVAFYRGRADDNVYSINVDGTGEKAIIISRSLPVLGRGAIKALTFVPKTHILLFNTYLCDASPKGPSYNAPDCTVGLFGVDTDTGKTSELVAGLSGNTMQDRNFEISPDGRYISVAASGHLDIYFLDSTGSADLNNSAVQYRRTRPDEYLPVQYWLPNSSALIAVVAASSSNEPGTPPYTYAVWRYTLRNIMAVQIPFDPPITFNSGCSFSISPDRNWIVFLGDETGDITKSPALYLGNLLDGSMKAVAWDWQGYDCQALNSSWWSPNSRYFGVGKTVLTIDGPFIEIGGYFGGWIDSTHYYYSAVTGTHPIVIKNYAAELGGGSVLIPDDFWTVP